METYVKEIESEKIHCMKFDSAYDVQKFETLLEIADKCNLEKLEEILKNLNKK